MASLQQRCLHDITLKKSAQKLFFFRPRCKQSVHWQRVMDVVIIGAGAAGIHIARHLVQNTPRTKLCLLESSARVGGRIKTMYEDDASISYESGPWRIPKSHERARAFLAQGGAVFQPAPTPVPTFAKEQAEEGRVGLTTWESNALRHSSPAAADLLDLATAYADQTHSAVGSAPYIVPPSEAQGFYVVQDGFSKAIDNLADSIRGVTRFNHRVLDVTRGSSRRYAVRVSRRTGHNRFSTITIQTNAVFICVPPSVSKDWTLVQMYARSLVSAVEAGELQHIYVRHAAHRRGLHYAHKMLGQVVSSQYDNSDWFQISYSSGRLSKMWYNLYLQDDTTMWSQLFKAFGWHGAELPRDKRLHMWPVAYHKWKAVPNFSLERAVQNSVRVNDVELPGVYYAGEAFSSFQAWIEGALETAERALHAYDIDMHARRHLTQVVCNRDDEHVFVEGRPLDVSKWSAVHPGGSAALKNHKNEDVTQLMHHMGHSAHAWAIVHALK